MELAFVFCSVSAFALKLSQSDRHFVSEHVMVVVSHLGLESDAAIGGWWEEGRKGNEGSK
jgi:hypothetical protein